METAKQAPYVQLPVYQGPMDLLLHLIRQNKIDIYDIPIAFVADQFILTLKQMEAFDMEIASEFLVLAAQLLYLKSCQLLPLPQKTEEEAEREEEMKQDLIERLVTYSAFKEAAAYLGSKAEITGSKYFREIDLDEVLAQFPAPNPLQGIGMSDLLRAFHTVLRRVEQGEDIHYVEAGDISVDLMAMDMMRRLLLSPQGMKFSRLLRYHSRVEIVVAFLALLELLKGGRIRAEQSSKTNEIFLVPTDKAWDFEQEESG